MYTVQYRENVFLVVCTLLLVNNTECTFDIFLHFVINYHTLGSVAICLQCFLYSERLLTKLPPQKVSLILIDLLKDITAC